jgi:hypothetical protein
MLLGKGGYKYHLHFKKRGTVNRCCTAGTSTQWCTAFAFMLMLLMVSAGSINIFHLLYIAFFYVTAGNAGQEKEEDAQRGEQ